MAPEIKSAQVNLRLPPSLKEAAEKAAAEDHRSLTSLIEKLLSEYTTDRSNLDEWHDRAFARFLGLVGDRKLADRASLGTFARSYRLHVRDGDGVTPNRLLRELNSAYRSLDTALREHHVFYPYTRRELAPYFIQDKATLRGRADEILECFVAPPDVELGVDLWRVSPSGLAAHISIHREDEKEDSPGRGRRFYPPFLSLGLTDIVLHASALAERFPAVEFVEFRCEWSGLRERELVGADGRLERRTGQIARADGRTTRRSMASRRIGAVLARCC